MGGLVNKPRARWHPVAKVWVVIGCGTSCVNSNLIMSISGWYDKVYGKANHGYR